MSRALLAPDKFAGACSALEAAEALARGLRSVDGAPEPLLCPIADGGEGTGDVLALHAERVIEVSVPGPWGSPLMARVLILPRQVVIESADANGIRHRPRADLDPWTASTEGVGVLLRAALAHAPDRPLAIGLGGSATVDGGIGLLHALGAHLLDADGHPVPPTVEGLPRLHTVNLTPARDALDDRCLEIWSDVTAPLLGSAEVTGASFLRQKGVAEAEIPTITHAWAQLAEALRRGGSSLSVDTPGGGAAGGLGYALLSLGATLRSGADAVLDAVGFEDHLRRATHVVTGEGRFDAPSLRGKGPGQVLQRALDAGRHAVVVAGAVLTEAEGVHTVAITPDGEPLSEALPATLPRLEAAGAALGRRWAATPPRR